VTRAYNNSTINVKEKNTKHGNSGPTADNGTWLIDIYECLARFIFLAIAHITLCVYQKNMTRCFVVVADLQNIRANEYNFNAI